MDKDLRTHLLAEPEEILDDKDLMAALIAASERAQGPNVVDMRGIAMARLEARVETLEGTQRDVIIAAYDNLRSTTMLHRATLDVIDAHRLQTLLDILGGAVLQSLRLSSIRLVLEPDVVGTSLPVLAASSPVLATAEAGFIEDYLTQGRKIQTRPITLRQATQAAAEVYGSEAEVTSEALLLLTCKTRPVRAMLALGSEDPARFKPAHGTDLLAFFSGVVERVLNRLLL